MVKQNYENVWDEWCAKQRLIEASWRGLRLAVGGDDIINN